MAFIDPDEEIECEIIESYGIFSAGIKSWNKEVNLVSWNGRPAKLDIRNWQRDHKKCGKGITLTREEAEALVKLLSEIARAKPKAERTKTEKNRTTKKPSLRIPVGLEPFYRELKLTPGAEPDDCKIARNLLLKKYHPDMNAGNVTYATRKTIKIKEAYERIIAWWEAAKY